MNRRGIKAKWWRRTKMRRIAMIDAVVIDTDGVLTDGSAYCDADGNKLFKVFGPDDHDGIRAILHTGMRVLSVSADPRGEAIARSHAAHNDSEWLQTSARTRADDVRAYGIEPKRALYIGDGIHDAEVMHEFALGACPSDAWPGTVSTADIVAGLPGGKRAVAQILMYVVKKKGM